MLLQTGQLLSNIGTRLTSIAYPLLVLALTGSAAMAGFVLFARTIPHALFALPAGVVADRYDRKWLMIGADAVRVVAVSVLVVVVALGSEAFWLISVIAFVEGVGTAFFIAAYPGSVRSVVPTHQLPDAAAVQTGRNAIVQLAGSPLGGALFTIARVLPFVVDVISYAFSAISLLLMRAKFQEEREHDHLAASVAAAGRSPLRLAPAVPPNRCLDLRPAQLRRPEHPLRDRRHRHRPGSLGRRGGAARRRVLRRHPPGDSTLAVHPAGPTRPGRVRARALDVGRLCRLSRLAERLRARRVPLADRARHPVHRLGRPRLPDRDDARPAARPSGVGVDDVRDRHLADRAAHHGRAHHRGVVASRHRPVRRAWRWFLPLWATFSPAIRNAPTIDQLVEAST